jgi:hypothetical protein
LSEDAQLLNAELLPLQRKGKKKREKGFAV